MTDEQARVLAALRHGRENARTQRELAVIAGLPVRKVQTAIESLRREGYAIASGDRGCWKARNADDLGASNRLLHAHLKSQYTTLRNQQRIERKMRAEERGVTPLALWSEAA